MRLLAEHLIAERMVRFCNQAQLIFKRHWLEAKILDKQLRNFTALRMATERFFAKDQLIIRLYFEAAAFGWNQGQTFNAGGKILGKFCCQTDSAWGKVSLHAIFDTQFVFLHLYSPFWFRLYSE